MAADGTSIKNDIDNELANKGYRGVRVMNIITILKKTVGWVTTAINGNLGTWFKAGTSNQATSNADDVYRTGKVGVGVSNPVTAVDVAGSVAFTDYLTYRSGGVNKAYIGNGGAVGGGPNDLGIRVEQGRIILATMQAGVPVKRLMVLESGNIAVGRDDAIYRIDVADNVQDANGTIMMLTNATTTPGQRRGAKVRFHQGGVSQWLVGVQGEIDAFAIQGWANGAFPFFFFIDSKGFVGIGTESPQEKLHVVGRLRSIGLVSDGANSPSLVPGAGLGSSPVASMGPNSVDMAGQITIRSNGSPLANAVLGTVTFNIASGRTPTAVLLSPASAYGAANANRVFVVATATGFTLQSGPVAVDSGQNLTFNYWVIF